MKRNTLMKYGLTTLMVSAALLCAIDPAQAAEKKPNIVVIMADDVGMWNISAYHHGMMGGRTPNIDRIAHEGALFSDYYAQQSCTAGRAAFNRYYAAGPSGGPDWGLRFALTLLFPKKG